MDDLTVSTNVKFSGPGQSLALSPDSDDQPTRARWDSVWWRVQGFPPRDIYRGSEMSTRLAQYYQQAVTIQKKPPSCRVHGEQFSQCQESLRQVDPAASNRQCFRILKAQRTVGSRNPHRAG